jgi:Histidine kinase-, DNA gyrase B-, and HSP90-like ATPase
MEGQVEVVAVSAGDRHEAASAPVDRGRDADASDARRRQKARATQRLEKAQVTAFTALREVSSYSQAEVELPVFFKQLGQTIARIVGARRAVFWRLGADRTLAVQPQAYGFAAASPVHRVDFRLPWAAKASSKTSSFDGLQSLFRVTGGDIRRERVDLSAMAAEIVEEMRASSPDRRVAVEIDSELAVSADARLARIMLTNLISNAWKFTATKQDPAIEIGCEHVDGEARHFVRDNGVGFDMIYSHKLFGAFQRLHSQSEFPGVGIGLATVRRIVNRHGGRCWAEGAVGEGAAFYFVL